MMRIRSSASQHSTTWACVVRGGVEDLLHVPPAAFDLEELRVAQGDVGRGEVRL